MNLAPLVGSTPEIVEHATARRAALWPLLEAAASRHPRLRGRMVDLSRPDPALQRLLARLAAGNNAHYWLGLREDLSPEYAIRVLEQSEFSRNISVSAWFFSEQSIQQRETERRRAADAARFLGLKKLTGTEKQIAWAETIRAQRIADLPGREAQLLALPGAGTARFWIDSRDEPAPDMLGEKFAQYAKRAQDGATKSAAAKRRRRGPWSPNW